jgi:hypothetical protein
LPAVNVTEEVLYITLMEGVDGMALTVTLKVTGVEHNPGVGVNV